MTSKVVAVLQARVSSQRLPEKVLKPILGEPMVFRMLERVRKSKHIQQVILATSNDTNDDALEVVGKKAGVAVFRGSLDDVLDRFYCAAKAANPDYVVRLTGDCPLIDPAVIDETIEFALKNNLDYASNALEPTYPDGLDVEVIGFECLSRAWREAKLKSEREHVTPFIYGHPEIFKIGSYKNKIDLSSLRWTVDEERDFELVTTIYEALYSKNPSFGINEVLSFLEKYPQLKTMNTHIKRNEGYEKSLRKD